MPGSPVTSPAKIDAAFFGDVAVNAPPGLDSLTVGEGNVQDIVAGTAPINLDAFAEAQMVAGNVGTGPEELRHQPDDGACAGQHLLAAPSGPVKGPHDAARTRVVDLLKGRRPVGSATAIRLVAQLATYVGGEDCVKWPSPLRSAALAAGCEAKPVRKSG